MSEKSVRLENLTSVGARCEGGCGMARSTKEQHLSAKISCQERDTSLFFPCYWQEKASLMTAPSPMVKLCSAARRGRPSPIACQIEIASAKCAESRRKDGPGNCNRPGHQLRPRI